MNQILLDLIVFSRDDNSAKQQRWKYVSSRFNLVQTRLLIGGIFSNGCAVQLAHFKLCADVSRIARLSAVFWGREYLSNDKDISDMFEV